MDVNEFINEAIEDGVKAGCLEVMRELEESLRNEHIVSNAIEESGSCINHLQKQINEQFNSEF